MLFISVILSNAARPVVSIMLQCTSTNWPPQIVTPEKKGLDASYPQYYASRYDSDSQSLQVMVVGPGTLRARDLRSSGFRDIFRTICYAAPRRGTTPVFSRRRYSLTLTLFLLKLLFQLCKFFLQCSLKWS